MKEFQRLEALMWEFTERANSFAVNCNVGQEPCQEAVMEMGLTPEEALTGATLNAAWSLGLQQEVGCIERGRMADFLVLDGETPATFAYLSGARPIRSVWKLGERAA